MPTTPYLIFGFPCDKTTVGTPLAGEEGSKPSCKFCNVHGTPLSITSALGSSTGSVYEAQTPISASAGLMVAIRRPLYRKQSNRRLGSPSQSASICFVKSADGPLAKTTVSFCFFVSFCNQCSTPGRISP